MVYLEFRNQILLRKDVIEKILNTEDADKHLLISTLKAYKCVNIVTIFYQESIQLTTYITNNLLTFTYQFSNKEFIEMGSNRVIIK